VSLTTENTMHWQELYGESGQFWVGLQLLPIINWLLNRNDIWKEKMRFHSFVRKCIVDSFERIRAYPFSRSWKNELVKLARQGRNPLHLPIPRLNFYIAFIQMGPHFLIIGAHSFRKLVKIDSTFRNMCLWRRHVYLVELQSRLKSYMLPNYCSNE